MELLKKNEKGKTYATKDFKILYRNKGSISGDNEINVKETIYLITGTMKVTLREKTWKEEAPATIHFPEKTYHKLEALTDCSMVLFEN